jgi:hypothetical protein
MGYLKENAKRQGAKEPKPFQEADVYEKPTGQRVGGWIRSKIQGDPEIKQARVTAERKGRLERAEREGYARGVGQYATKKERGEYGIPEQPRQTSGGRTGFRTTMKHSDDIFGWSSNGGGGAGIGLGFGFGDEPKRTAPPMRKTVYNPRTGKVETYEPIQQKQIEHDNGPNISIGFDAFGGPPGLSKKKGQHEKHPYDLF